MLKKASKSYLKPQMYNLAGWKIDISYIKIKDVSKTSRDMGLLFANVFSHWCTYRSSVERELKKEINQKKLNIWFWISDFCHSWQSHLSWINSRKKDLYLYYQFFYMYKVKLLPVYNNCLDIYISYFT